MRRAARGRRPSTEVGLLRSRCCCPELPRGLRVGGGLPGLRGRLLRRRGGGRRLPVEGRLDAVEVPLHLVGVVVAELAALLIVEEEALEERGDVVVLEVLDERLHRLRELLRRPLGLVDVVDLVTARTDLPVEHPDDHLEEGEVALQLLRPGALEERVQVDDDGPGALGARGVAEAELAVLHFEVPDFRPPFGLGEGEGVGAILEGGAFGEDDLALLVHFDAEGAGVHAGDEGLGLFQCVAFPGLDRVQSDDRAQEGRRHFSKKI